MAQIQAEKTVSTAKETQYKFDRIPVVALRNIVAFPNAVIHVDIERKLSVNAVKYAFNEHWILTDMNLVTGMQIKRLHILHARMVIHIA